MDVILLSSLLLSAATTAAAMKTHFVYWNSSNPVFKSDTATTHSSNVIDVNEGNLPWEYDQLHLICPLNTAEQHVVYSVSRQEFESCRVTSPRPRIVAICNKPETFRYFTITFRAFSPTPGGLEFKPGQDYYFISTSTRRDLHRRAGGFCSTDNMKMVFRVGASATQPAQPSAPQLNVKAEPAEPRVWSARVPQHRNDYIYYYKPWQADRRHRASSAADQWNTNEILTALPLTAAAPGLAPLLPALALLLPALLLL